ncbi:Glycerate dehydrogenase [Camellia lanceoleosa]|uniref:Glycerate dehydrogenase n=1 Tax=Camellia lanceoleosa TaxID=1840588 RepID=A0ACC0FC74_9ERIC|nr:Glycerate dehydrogenase [Camellia lanceoleosa]
MRRIGVLFFKECPMAEKIRYSCDSTSFASEGYGSRAVGERNVSARKENGCWWEETLFSALSRAGGKAFSNMVVGYNNVDVNAATKCGVAVGNTPSLKLDIVPGPIVSPNSSQPLVYNIRNSTDASGFSWNDKRSRQGNESSILTRSWLSFLSGDSGAPGLSTLVAFFNVNSDARKNQTFGRTKLQRIRKERETDEDKVCFRQGI